MAWYPGYEAPFLIVSYDTGFHLALMHETAVSLTPVLKQIPNDEGVGDLDAPLFHLRKRAARTPQVDPYQQEDFRGLLVKGGLRVNG